MIRNHTTKLSQEKLKEIKRKLKPHRRGVEFQTKDGMIFRKTLFGIKRVR